MITVTLPDGRKVDVRTDDPEKAAKVAHTWSTNNPKVGHSLREKAGGIAGQYLDGVLPGSSGFLRGVREVVKNAVTAPFSDQVDFEPTKSYDRGRRLQNARNRQAMLNNPNLSGIAQGAGMAAGMALPATKIAQGATLVQKAKAGATTAGAYGALSGAMASDQDTLAGKGSDALYGGLIGSTVGGALPVAAKVAGKSLQPLKPLTDPVTQAVGRGFQAVASRLPKAPPFAAARRSLAQEGQQLARDPARAAANAHLDDTLRSATNPQTGEAFTPQEVLAEVQRRQEIGVPAIAADVHEGARRSLGAASRSSGPAVMSVRRMIDQRQQQATERMRGHIADTLGPVANVEAQANTLRREALDASRPLYVESDRANIPFTEELQELMARPSAREALQAAGRQLQDEGLDPSVFGLIQDAEGIFRPTQRPTMAAYDRVKGALDETVYAGSQPFQPAAATRDSRGASTIRSRLLEIMDGTPDQPGLNPAWKPARDAYAGPIQSKQALELGEDMVGKDAEDIANRMADMGDSQQGFFRLGHRSGLSKDAAAQGDWGNTASRLAGSTKKRDALRAAHGDAAEDLLARTLPEHEAFQTFQAIRGGSPTADRLSEIAQQDRQLEDAASGMIQILAGHPGAGAWNIVSALGRGERQGQEVKGHIASVLAEQDPQALQAALTEILDERSRRLQVDQRKAKAVQRTSRLVAELGAANLVQGTIEPTGGNAPSY